MAKQTVTSSSKKKTTVKVTAKAPEGKMKCNVCGGTGYQKTPKKKKK